MHEKIHIKDGSDIFLKRERPYQVIIKKNGKIVCNVNAQHIVLTEDDNGNLLNKSSKIPSEAIHVGTLSIVVDDFLNNLQKTNRNSLSII